MPTRVGNGIGDIKSFGDNKLPESDWDGLGESCVTMKHTWGYKGFDNNWKSVEEVKKIQNKCRKCGANLLLNIGPDHLGRFPVPAIEVLKELGNNGKAN